jgi:hypothetical protein
VNSPPLREGFTSRVAELGIFRIRGTFRPVGTMAARRSAALPPIPVPIIGPVEFHIVEADTPFLMCLKDMDDLKVYFNNLKNVLIREYDKRTFPIVRKLGHPFMVWGPMTINYLTETELRQLHRRFGHPSAERLVRLLERAGHDDDQHRKVINCIIKYCSLWTFTRPIQVYYSRRRRI